MSRQSSRQYGQGTAAARDWPGKSAVSPCCSRRPIGRGAAAAGQAAEGERGNGVDGCDQRSRGDVEGVQVRAVVLGARRYRGDELVVVREGPATDGEGVEVRDLRAVGQAKDVLASVGG